jgi:hypothetical protein
MLQTVFEGMINKSIKAGRGRYGLFYTFPPFPPSFLLKHKNYIIKDEALQKIENGRREDGGRILETEKFAILEFSVFVFKVRRNGETLFIMPYFKRFSELAELN